ncbi:MAG: hypothetical protein K0U93_30455 [Gammaproteobacteria bacterium]|nr:hypothetical protein [Gammaproteobacteria bacterium]
MSDNRSNKGDTPEEPALTSFGEPVWVDVLKTLGVAFATIMTMFAIGAFLGLMLIAPWGRASFDCSMFCVMEQEVREFFDMPAAPTDK